MINIGPFFTGTNISLAPAPPFTAPVILPVRILNTGTFYTAVLADYTIISIVVIAGVFTINLPAALPRGIIFNIKRVGTVVKVVAIGGTIDGAVAGVILTTANENVTIQYANPAGGQWFII